MSKIAKALEKAEQTLKWMPDTPLQPETVTRSEHVPAESQDVSVAQFRNARHEVAVNYKRTKVEAACFQQMDSARLLGEHAPQVLRDAFNIVRTRVLQQTRAKGLNTIMVTSPGRGDGKTTVATNLAISIARDASQTALLVDANLRRPGIACGLGLSVSPGLTEYLIDQTPLDDLFVNPGIQKLVILPAGASQDDSVDLLSSPRMQRLVQELKSRYPDRYVIFDCPHLVGMPDALAFAEYVDGVILVAGEGGTARTEMQAALALLENRNLLGIVLNKAL